MHHLIGQGESVIQTQDQLSKARLREVRLIGAATLHREHCELNIWPLGYQCLLHGQTTLN